MVFGISGSLFLLSVGVRMSFCIRGFCDSWLLVFWVVFWVLLFLQGPPGPHGVPGFHKIILYTPRLNSNYEGPFPL